MWLFLKTIFRAVLGIQQNWEGGQKFPICSLSPHIQTSPSPISLTKMALLSFILFSSFSFLFFSTLYLSFPFYSFPFLSFPVTLLFSLISSSFLVFFFLLSLSDFLYKQLYHLWTRRVLFSTPPFCMHFISFSYLIVSERNSSMMLTRSDARDIPVLYLILMEMLYVSHH